MQFNVSKWKVMHVRKRKPRQSYCTDNTGLKPVEVKKDLVIKITSDLKCSQQCEYAYTKANRVTGMIKKALSYKEPKIMLNLYKTLVRPHVEYGSSAWNLYYKKEKELLKRIQHRYTKMIKDMRDRTYEDRLKCLRLWTLEERRNRYDIICL